MSSAWARASAGSWSTRHQLGGGAEERERVGGGAADLAGADDADLHWRAPGNAVVPRRGSLRRGGATICWRQPLWRSGHVLPPVASAEPRPADRRGRGGAAAPGLRLRRSRRERSVPAARRLPQRRSGGVSRRLPLASAPGDRDDHLRARRVGGAFGFARQPRGAGAGVGAVDDRGVGDPAPGDAARGGVGADARVPALGEPAVVAEDDRRRATRTSRGRTSPRSSTTTGRW